MDEQLSSQADPTVHVAVLRRTKKDRVIAGVAAGLGRYLDIDPVWLRIAFVVLAIGSFGAGVLLYIVGIVVIPEERDGDVLGEAPAGQRAAGRAAIGAALVGVGVLVLLGELLPRFDAWAVVWPVAVIAIGVAFVMRGGRR